MLCSFYNNQSQLINVHACHDACRLIVGTVRKRYGSQLSRYELSGLNLDLMPDMSICDQKRAERSISAYTSQPD